MPPEGQTWTFDESVAKAFDDMLERSITSYREMRRWVDMLVRHKIAEFRRTVSSSHVPTVVDLGASRGEAVDRFINDVSTARYLGKFELMEVSEPMRAVLEQRYAGRPHVRVHDFDLRYRHAELAKFQPLVVLSILTTIFTPLQYRPAIVKSISTALQPQDGLFVWVEKVLGDTPKGDDLLVETYHQMKREHGYDDEAIVRKRMSLEFAQTALLAPWNEDLLDKAGFKWRTRFFQSLNFVGWVAGF